jgi:anti-sigma factor RsiW
LGGPLRELPGLQLMSVEVGPGGVVAGSLGGRPVARLSYADAAGHVLVLTQQRLGDAQVTTEDRAGTLVVDPSGMRAYRWNDDHGYRLILMGTVSSDSLRSLAESVR